MAGLPQEVTDRAQVLLKNLEGTDLSVHGTNTVKKRGRVQAPEVQLTLFEMKDDPLRAELASLDIDGMTPIEAIQTLAALRKKAGERQ
jgi:DNA mismatch repair protein MutS